MTYSSLLTETITVLRVQGEGGYVKGRFEGTEVAEISMKASVQPTKGEELQNPPEGQRTMELVDIFTKGELLTVQTSQFKRADLVVYNGRKYEVKKVERWAGPLPHYKSVGEFVLDNAEGET